jgi:signal transduction histidine kinase
VWRDWAVVVVAVSATIFEGVLREDRAWLPVLFTVSIVVAVTLLWRRTHPLSAVATAFGTLITFDVARIVAIEVTGLASVAAALILPYALLRWGSGREVGIGLGIILVWLGVTHVADPTTVDEVVAVYGFFLLSAALGASIRFYAANRIRDIEQARLRLRNELARELHDTVGHHVSAIAIQAQAGRALAAADPDRALTVLGTIENAASRALEDMRAMVGVLRDAGEPDLAPQPGIADIDGLARDDGWPRVEVHRSDNLDQLAPSAGAALFRIAQEAVTNAMRHARNATAVIVEVRGEDQGVRLTVSDDGDPATTSEPTSGFGLLGMSERAALAGGTLRAGHGPQGGWSVEVLLPTTSPRAMRPPAARGSV